MTFIPIQEVNGRQSKNHNGIGIGIGGNNQPMYTLQAGQQHGVAYVPDVARCDTTGEGNRQDGESVNFVCVTGDRAHTLDSHSKGSCTEDGTERGVPVIAFSGKDHGADAGAVSPPLRAMGHDASHANAGGQVAIAVSLRGRDGGGTAELTEGANPALRASQGGGDKPHVLTLLTNDKIGVTQQTKGNGYVYGKKARPRKILRILQKEIGKKAFFDWCLGVVVALQSKEILQSGMHGVSLRRKSVTVNRLVNNSLPCKKISTGRPVQYLRGGEWKGYSSQRWRSQKQFTRQFDAYLSVLSQQATPTAQFLRDLREATKRTGLLQQAFNTAEKIRRSAGLQSSLKKEMQDLRASSKCSKFMRETLHASKKGGRVADQLEGVPDLLKGGQGVMQVRRLTPRRECERLQGMQDDHTLIPVKKVNVNRLKSPKRNSDGIHRYVQHTDGSVWQLAADGPRYRAIGNSMAVPVVRWIGERIEWALQRTSAAGRAAAS